MLGQTVILNASCETTVSTSADGVEIDTDAACSGGGHLIVQLVWGFVCLLPAVAVPF